MARYHCTMCNTTWHADKDGNCPVCKAKPCCCPHCVARRESTK